MSKIWGEETKEEILEILNTLKIDFKIMQTPKWLERPNWDNSLNVSINAVDKVINYIEKN